MMLRHNERVSSGWITDVFIKKGFRVRNNGRLLIYWCVNTSYVITI